MRVASELERSGQVNGLVEQLGGGTKCGAAGRQVGQPGVVEPDRGQAGNGQRIGIVIMEQQQALGGVAGVAVAVAGEVRDGAGAQVG
jgi:hypothetical protein